MTGVSPLNFDFDLFGVLRVRILVVRSEGIHGLERYLACIIFTGLGD